MQATALGKYLLYGRAGDFMAAGIGNSLKAATAPTSAADWRVDVAPGNTFKLSLPSVGKVLGRAGDQLVLGGSADTFTFQSVGACAVYPEVQNSWTGDPIKGKTNWAEVKGTIDLHMHWMAFEFLGGRAHCGRPWHPFGAPEALKDCLDHAASGGCGAVLENVLFGNPARCHSADGWPSFRGWPHPQSLTHEMTYHKWVERAYRGGVRLIVNLFVENRVLCELYPFKRDQLKPGDCNEMDSVRRQNRDIEALEDYIDAQNGGPGRGWMRIVTSPEQARRVISQGKLALIKGIEISEPFDCGIYNGRPKCDRATIARLMDEVYGYGVRQMELINKFDNALGGVAGDGGSTGVVVNSGNRYATGRYWDMQKCDGAPDEQDNQQIGIYNHDQGDLLTNALESSIPPRHRSGLPRELELQHVRPQRARRVRRHAPDEEGHGHRPRPPQRPRTQGRAVPRGGQPLLRLRVQPQLEHA